MKDGDAKMPPMITETTTLPLYELGPMRVPHSAVIEIVTKKALDEAEEAISDAQAANVDTSRAVHCLKLAKEFFYRGDFERTIRFTGKVLRTLE